MKLKEKKNTHWAEAFGKRLNELVGGAGKVKPFAKRCGVSDKGIANYLNGQSLPGLDILAKIAEANNVTIAWLVGEIDQKTGDAVVSASPTTGPSLTIPLLIEETLRRDPDGGRLLEKTAAVLQSRTAHAGALRSNIEAFYEAVADKKDKEGLQQEVGRISAQMEVLVEKIDHLEGKVDAKKAVNSGE